MKNGSQLSTIFLGAAVSAITLVLAMKLGGFVSAQMLIWLGFSLMPALIYLRVRHLRRLWYAGKKGSLKNLRSQSPRTLASWINKNLIGHKGEVERILTTIERNMTLLQRGRHLGAFLLMGPTGTGKTFFSHLLADSLCGPRRILVIPMSQYSSPAADPATIFTQILSFYRESPEFVLLLDEIDRASVHVQNSLLHLLDKGEIVNPVSAERMLLQFTVIVATTNLGVESLTKSGAHMFTDAGLRDALALEGFEKALITRFDGVHHFAELSKIDTITVALLQLRAHYQQFQIIVKFVEPELLVKILEKNAAYSEFGVRQLQRLIRNMSDAAIMEARRRGTKSIVIGFDDSNSAVRVVEEKRSVA